MLLTHSFVVAEGCLASGVRFWRRTWWRSTVMRLVYPPEANLELEETCISILARGILPYHE